MIRLPAEGESFGRYRLLRKLGQGGMGVVYAALDTTLDREVAVKLVTPHLAGDEGFRARFQHEAATLARLDSPQIVRIYDHGEQDDVLFLVTQLIDGGDLLTLIRREGALPPALATDVLQQVLHGLVDAHAVGVVHRDIKPANVLLRSRGRETEAFLCDFGIATTVGADLSRTGTVAGSLPYMAPERHQGEDAGPRGDVYAAGCLLWHALTGSAPYAGTDVEVALAHIQAPVPSLPGKDEFSTRVNQVLVKALAKEPKKRYPTARAMLSELEQVARLAPDAISLPGATAFRQPIVLAPSRLRRWRPAIVAALATAAVLATTLVAGAMVDRDAEVASTPPVSPTGPGVVGDALADAAGLDREVAETPTLRPEGAGSRPGGAGARPGAAASEDGDVPGARVTGPDLGGEAPEPLPDRSGTKGGSDSERKPKRDPKPDPDPAPAPSPEPEPEPKYRCWDGRMSNDLGTCGEPHGAAGLRWVFNIPPSNCTTPAPGATDGVVLHITCYRTYNGHDVRLQFMQWSSVARANDWARGPYGDRSNPWVVGGATFGTLWSRSWPEDQHQYMVMANYDRGPMSMQIKSSSFEGRKYFWERRAWRSPANWRGVLNR